MTLLGSGGMTGQLIRDELRQTGGNLVWNDATQRWLTEKPSGNIIIPTDYYSKRAIKRTGQFSVAGLSNPLGVTIDLGIDYPGRMIFVDIISQASSGSSLLTTSITLNGVTMTQGTGWQDPAQAYSHGIAWLAGLSGTSANLVANYNRAATNLFVQVYSVSNPGTLFHSGSSGAAGNSTGFSLNVPTNGIIMSSSAATGALGFTSNYSSVTKETDSDVGGGVKYATGVDNRMSAQTSRSVGVSMTGGIATFTSFAAVSFG